MFFDDKEVELIEYGNDDTNEPEENKDTSEPIEENEENQQIIDNDNLVDVLPEEQENSEIPFDEFIEVYEESEPESISLDTIIDNQNTIIELLTVSDNDVFIRDSKFNADIVNIFLVSALFGCFVCFAFFRKW